MLKRLVAVACLLSLIHFGESLKADELICSAQTTGRALTQSAPPPPTQDWVPPKLFCIDQNGPHEAWINAEIEEYPVPPEAIGNDNQFKSKSNGWFVEFELPCNDISFNSIQSLMTTKCQESAASLDYNALRKSTEDADESARERCSEQLCSRFKETTCPLSKKCDRPCVKWPDKCDPKVGQCSLAQASKVEKNYQGIKITTIDPVLNLCRISCKIADQIVPAVAAGSMKVGCGGCALH